MMGLRGAKGGAEQDALSRKARRLIQSGKGETAEKRSFWKRNRKLGKQAARSEAYS
jgi:hypothetical protein